MNINGREIMANNMKTAVSVAVAVFLCFLPELNAGEAVDNGTHTTVDKSTHTTVEKIEHMKVKVLLEPPFVMNSKISPNHYEGLFIDLLDDACRRANMTYTISPDVESKYGYEFAPGNWTGLIGKVQNKEADLAVAPLSIRSKRMESIDFTVPVMTAGLRILFKVPDPWSDSESFAILLSPFTPGLWVMLALLFIITSMAFYVIGRFSPYEDHAFVGKAATYEGLTFVNSFVYSLSSLLFQGYTAVPKSISGKILAFTWWIFGVLVIAAYTASLCATFLSIKPSISSLPFSTFEELSQQIDVAYGIVEGGSTEYFLKTSKQPLQAQLFATINANADKVKVKSTQEGIRRVQASRGKYAFIMEGPMAEYISEQPPCDLMTLGEELSNHAYGFACRKDSDVCPKLNRAIQEMVENDEVYVLKRKWFDQGCNTGKSAGYVVRNHMFFDTFGGTPDYFAKRAVTLRRFSTGFLFLFVGVALSALLLVAEMFYAKRRGTAVPQRIPRSGVGDQERIDREYHDEDA